MSDLAHNPSTAPDDTPPPLQPPHARHQRLNFGPHAQHRCAQTGSSKGGEASATHPSLLTARFPINPDPVQGSAQPSCGQSSDCRLCAVLLRTHSTEKSRGQHRVKSFFELLGKAMQSTGMTLRLCLLMAVASAAAYAISQLQ